MKEYRYGKNILDKPLINDAERIQEALKFMHEMHTEFEIVTALGFLYFYECNCDIVVLVVGLGRRLDSTNVIFRPESAVITAIDLEHTEELENTLAKIAREKAGVIKCYCDVVLYE